MVTRVSAATNDIQLYIESSMGKKVKSVNSSGSSDWASMYTISCEDGSAYFAKVARGRDTKMFKGEEAGLNAMYKSGSLVVPQVYHVGELTGPGQRGSWILMDYLAFGGRLNQEELGRQLARMHLAEPCHDEAKQGKFGFPVDNTIGGTPQQNPWTDNWIDFFREHRFKYMLKLLNDPKLNELGAKIADNMEALFEDIKEPIRPSILHGDLWSGNIACVDGKPSIYDPACYYGHHEAEFGMDWCAGFNGSFWKGYRELIPEAPGFKVRHTLYTSYHIMNHMYMFGSSYRGQSVALLADLASKL